MKKLIGNMVGEVRGFTRFLKDLAIELLGIAWRYIRVACITLVGTALVFGVLRLTEEVFPASHACMGTPFAFWIILILAFVYTSQSVGFTTVRGASMKKG